MKVRKFLHAASESCADMLYATRFRAPDAFGFLGQPGAGSLLLSNLEIDRARATCPWAEAASFSAIADELRGSRRKAPQPAKVIAAFLRQRKARRILVPGDFPLGLAKALKKEGIRVRVAKGPFWPQRRIKTPAEIRAMAAASRLAETGMARAMEVLAAAKIRRGGFLSWGNRRLSSEILRAEIETAIVYAGGEARGDTIVACGEQACDPHERGHGALRVGELIIIDIFPRDTRSGFFGDITRTVVKGPAGEPQKALWTLCLEAQNRALDAIKPGTRGKTLQNDIRQFFREAGYPDEMHEGRWRGFFHGLGHGLGLEVHEEPRLADAVFEPGEVFTVEPGLYWPGVGGVRHEDVVAITPTGKRLLTRAPKPLEID